MNKLKCEIKSRLTKNISLNGRKFGEEKINIRNNSIILKNSIINSTLIVQMATFCIITCMNFVICKELYEIYIHFHWVLLVSLIYLLSVVIRMCTENKDEITTTIKTLIIISIITIVLVYMGEEKLIEICKDRELVAALVNFYVTLYTIIIVSIIVIVLLFAPEIKYFLGENYVVFEDDVYSKNKDETKYRKLKPLISSYSSNFIKISFYLFTVILSCFFIKYFTNPFLILGTIVNLVILLRIIRETKNVLLLKRYYIVVGVIMVQFILTTMKFLEDTMRVNDATEFNYFWIVSILLAVSISSVNYFKIVKSSDKSECYTKLNNDYIMHESEPLLLNDTMTISNYDELKKRTDAVFINLYYLNKDTPLSDIKLNFFENFKFSIPKHVINLSIIRSHKNVKYGVLSIIILIVFTVFDMQSISLDMLFSKAYFDPNINRAIYYIQAISIVTSVLVLMYLEKFLNFKNDYMPTDYYDTIIYSYIKSNSYIVINEQLSEKQALKKYVSNLDIKVIEIIQE